MVVFDLKQERLAEACREAVLEVLETMYFELPVDEIECSAGPEPGVVLAMTSFDGSLQGNLVAAIPQACLSRLTAGFLGIEEEEVTTQQSAGVLIEFANMLCGATMSRMEPAGRLRIEQPRIVEHVDSMPENWFRFPLEGGSVDVAVNYSEQP